MNGMKAKKMWMAGLALLGIGSLALATKKVADDRKLMKTQEDSGRVDRDCARPFFRHGGNCDPLCSSLRKQSGELGWWRHF